MHCCVKRSYLHIYVVCYTDYALTMFPFISGCFSCSYTSQFNIFHQEEFLNVTGLSKMKLSL